MLKKRILQIIVPLVSCAQLIAADAYILAEPDPEWLNQESLSMLALERETMANRLTAYVANHLIEGERRDRELWARRLLGLALTLHPENPRAQQTNEALSAKKPTPELESELESEVLGQLLFHRALGLSKGDDADSRTSRYLIAAAAYIAPYFEEAAFAYEHHHIKEGGLNWEPISGETSKENPLSKTAQ